jgi:rhodanese-related sulfurtransferase
MDILAEQKLVNIDPHTLYDWMQAEEVLLVDVREIDEFENERIPGAIPMPLSEFDPRNVPAVPGKKTILTCFIGGRSADAASRLLAAGHDEAIQLDAGLFGWKEAGYETVHGRGDR